MARGKREVNSVEIARSVGVSRSTVSKVINNYPSISERTRQRVWDAIEKHGYYPDLSARIMAGKRTDTIALFLAGSGSFAGDMLVDVMLGVTIESAADAGYHVLTYIVRDADSPRTARSIKEVYYQRRVDAGIFVGFRNDFPVIEQLVDDGFVVGVFDQSARGAVHPNRAIANFDDERAAEQAIDYLVGLGHRSIGVVHGDVARNAGQGRCIGFTRALARNSIVPRDEWIMRCDFSQDDGHRQVLSMLEQCGEHPTAIAAVNDSVAFGAMEAIQAAGLSVPDDISVIGIDGHPLCGYATPRLTTFTYDFRTMFRSLIHTIATIVDGNVPTLDLHQVFSGAFTERESCAPPKPNITPEG